MAAATNRGLRRILAAALVIALTLSGLGRAGAIVFPPVGVEAPASGLGVPICHGGADPGAVDGAGDPARPVSHDCCDDCALLATAVLPAPPSLATPVPTRRPAAPLRAAGRAPVEARPRVHRLPRGPPAA